MSIGLFRSVKKDEANKTVYARLVDNKWEIVELSKGLVKTGLRGNKQILGQIVSVLNTLFDEEFKAAYVPADVAAVLLYEVYIPKKERRKPVFIAAAAPAPPVVEDMPKVKKAIIKKKTSKI